MAFFPQNRLNQMLPPGLTNTPLINNPDTASIASDTVGSDRLLPATSDQSQTPLLDMLKQHLMNPPNPANYQPSRTQQILGSIAGLGGGASPSTYQGGAALGFNYNPVAGQAASDQITEGPYRKAVGLYDDKAKALLGGANVEEKQFTNQRMLEQNKELDKIRQQNADTTQKKENDIREQKINELAAKVDKAEKDLSEKQREANLRKDSSDAILALRDAEFKTTEARHALELAQKDKEFQSKLDATTSHYKAQEDKWDADIKNAEERARIAEEAVKARGGLTGSETTTTKTVGAEPGKTLFGYHIPFTGSEGKTTTTTTEKKPLNPNATSAGTGPYGNIPNSQSNMPQAKVNADKMKRANDYLTAHNRAISDKNLQLLMATPEDQWPK